MASKLEINLSRLMFQCELMASNRNGNNDWRLEKYVCALEDLLADLRRSPSCPTNEVLTDYGNRIAFLKGVLQAEKLPNAIEKAMATQLITPGPVSKSEKLPREIHLQTTAKYTKEMRDELLGTNQGEGLRHRSPTSSEDLDSILQFHQNQQENIAEEMISLARSMKTNSLLASTVLRKDMDTLDKSSRLAEHNLSKLKVESEKLETHTQRACHWWIWLMLAIVTFIFISMVIFMKIFTKS